MNVDVNGAPPRGPAGRTKAAAQPSPVQGAERQRSGARSERRQTAGKRQRAGLDRTGPKAPDHCDCDRAAALSFGMMSRAWHLRGAALLLLFGLQLPCRLRAAAQPGETLSETQAAPSSEIQARSLPETTSTATPHATREDLFQDVDPKALAAILLQALHLEPEERPSDFEPSANEERVQSETKSSHVQLERAQGWETGQGRDRPLGEESPEQQEGEIWTRMLQRYSPVAKRAEPPQGRRASAPAHLENARSEVLQELEEYEQLRVHTKRKTPPSEPWEGARKLRQQQHLEHQLLQRRYEELAESRRQAEEARRAAAEEERLADMASDLLLQYLLKDGEDGEEEEARQASEEGSQKGSALLFEDEEGNVAEDKRSNEAPEEQREGQEEGEDDIDPSTIDRLIELSSKLHLPADDVIDIINDVEKKREGEEEMPEPFSKGKAPATHTRGKPKKNPSYPGYLQGSGPAQKSDHPLARQPSHRLPKEEQDPWNEVLRGDEYPAPKWFHVKPNSVATNYINPRTFQPPAYPRYPHLPAPVGPRDEYYDDSQAHDQELENYIEKVLRKRPQSF